MGEWKIDTKQWPIVVHSVDGVLTDAELDAYIAQADTILARKVPHVTVLDASRSGLTTPAVRARAAAWQKAHHEELKQYCRGTAYVVPSSVLRFVVMSLLLLTQLPTPFTTCETLDEALAWGKKRLDGAA